MNLTSKLRTLDEPIRVGFIGVGIFGSQVIQAIANTPGMDTVAIADIDTEKAITCFKRTGVDRSAITLADSANEVDATVDAGERAVTDVGMNVVEADVDVVLDATGNPDVGARHAFASLMSGKHFVNVSVEADTVCGRLLADIADRNGVTYSLAYGDQPSQIIELCEWAGSAGFEVVAAGKSSREPANYGTPDDAIDRHGFIDSFGEGLDPNPVIYNTFLDGTKTAVESVAAANALDLGIDTLGMHHPTVEIADIPNKFRPKSEGGVLDEVGVVDTVTPTDGKFSVFVVTRTESTQLQEYYAQRPNIVTSDDDEYQLFYRPFHFAPETTISIASAALLNEPTGVPRTHRTEVVAAAKQDLSTGDTIDGGGGYTIYGLAVDAAVAAAENYVPFELLTDAVVTESISRDDILTHDHVNLDTNQFLYYLRRIQEDSYL